MCTGCSDKHYRAEKTQQRDVRSLLRNQPAQRRGSAMQTLQMLQQTRAGKISQRTTCRYTATTAMERWGGSWFPLRHRILIHSPQNPWWPPASSASSLVCVRPKPPKQSRVSLVRRTASRAGRCALVPSQARWFIAWAAQRTGCLGRVSVIATVGFDYVELQQLVNDEVSAC